MKPQALLSAFAGATLCIACNTSDPSPSDDDGTGSETSTSTTTTGSTTDPDSTTATGSTTDSGSTTDTTGSVDESDSGSTTGAPACAEPNSCVAVAPEGWNGPVAMIEGTPDETAGCGLDFSVEEFIANTQLVADPATCECECGDAQDAACPSEVTIARSLDDAVCNGNGTAMFVVDASCQAHDTAGDFNWRVLPPEVEGGSCTPSATVMVPEAAWSAAGRGCALAAEPTDEGCEAGEVCMPALDDPFEPAFCIWQAGEHDCPAGDYTNRTVYYDDFSDDRDCSPCTCGDPTGTCSEPQVRLHPNGTCACVSANSCNVGTTCEMLGFDVDSMNLDVAPVLEGVASCEPSSVTPTGEATPTGATTVCCA